MTYAVDVNVLVYAADVESPYHPAARRVLVQVQTADELVYLFWPVIFGYLRVATSPRIFRNPIAPAIAIDGVQNLLALPRVRTVAEGEGFLGVLADVVRGVPVRGAFFSDAHIVALMRQYGVTTIYSHDRDFRKFDGIRVVDPFA